MIVLLRVWRWWIDSWRAPRRARLLYAAMGLAFATLALIAAIQGDAMVAVLAALGGAASLVLAAVAPRLSKWTATNRESR